MSNDEEKNTSLRLISYNAHHHDMNISVGAVRTIAIVTIVIRLNSIFLIWMKGKG